MIIGTKKTMDQLTALQWVELSEIPFTLTGSRFFGTAKPDSDWDFFTEFSAARKFALTDSGFIQEASGDSSAEDYIGFPGVIKIYRKENVHVQLINNIRIKWYVQNEILLPIFLAIKPHKVQARILWKAAMKAYYAGMEEQRRLIEKFDK